MIKLAAVTYTDGIISNIGTGDLPLVVWVSPATMDSNDTVAPTALTGRTIRVIQCWDTNDQLPATATLSAGVITIDAAGGATDSVYILMFTYS